MEGGIGPGRGVHCWNYGPFASPARLTFWIAYAHVDSRAWYSSLFVLWICIDGRLERWDGRLMVHLTLESAQESIWQNNMEIIGGPGNRTQVLEITKSLPATTPNVLLCKYNRNKRIYDISAPCAETRALIRMDHSLLATPSSSSFWNRKTQADRGGFKPPLISTVKNSD